MEIKNIEHLLHNVSLIEKKYDNLAEITGEHYNVFDILGKRNDELSHSSILANLLNAKGKHGQKDLFLKIFIEIIKNGFLEDENKMQFFKDFKTESSKAETEKFVGKVDYDSEQGGRIDIVVNNRNYNLIIENKVHADDQPLQLVRYKEFDKNAPILYLTLEGKAPSKSSKGDLEKGIDYSCISYQTEIVSWIEKCIEKTANKPIIRETLNQYLNLIKSLTNQSTNSKMSEEIKELIKRDFGSASEIVKNYENAKNDICSKIRDAIKDILNSKLDDKYEISYAGSLVSDKNSKIFLELKNHKDLGVFFGVEPFSGKGNKGSELFLGILDINQNNKDFFQKYSLKNSWWVEKIFFQPFEEFQIDFSDSDFLTFLAKNQENQTKLAKILASQIIEYIDSKEKYLLEICKEIKQKV